MWIQSWGPCKSSIIRGEKESWYLNDTKVAYSLFREMHVNLQRDRISRAVGCSSVMQSMYVLSSNFIAFKKLRFFFYPFAWVDIWQKLNSKPTFGRSTIFSVNVCWSGRRKWSNKWEEKVHHAQNRTALTILVTLSMTLLRRTPARSTRFNFVWKMDLSRLGTVWILYRYQHCIFQSNLQL